MAKRETANCVTPLKQFTSVIELQMVCVMNWLWMVFHSAWSMMPRSSACVKLGILAPEGEEGERHRVDQTEQDGHVEVVSPTLPRRIGRRKRRMPDDPLPRAADDPLSPAECGLLGAHV